MRKRFGPSQETLQAGLSERQYINSTANGTVPLDTAVANVFVLTLTGNVAITVTNKIPAGSMYSALLYLKNTNARTVTYPASFKWPNGSPPATSVGASAVDIVSFMTVDGGVTYQAAPIGFNFS